MTVTVENIQNALKSVIDPNTGKDLISSKSAKNIKVDGSDVSLDVVWPIQPRARLTLYESWLLPLCARYLGLKTSAPM